MRSNEDIGAPPRSYRHPGIELPASWQNRDGEKPASRRDLLPSRLQRMVRFRLIRLSSSIPTHMQAMWSKYGEYLLPIHGEIRPRSCLPGNASAILGCPNLEIPTSDDQRWTGYNHDLAKSPPNRFHRWSWMVAVIHWDYHLHANDMCINTEPLL